MKSGDVATKIKETYNFTVESISIKKDHKLTIYKGNMKKIDKHGIFF